MMSHIGYFVWFSAFFVCHGSSTSAIGTSFYYFNFQNIPQLNLNGDSQRQLGHLQLTLPQTNQAGSAWYDVPLDLSNGFETHFEFSVTMVENGGESGIAFVVQNDAPYVIGKGQEGIGYDGLKAALAIEFDTFKNDALNDGNGNHVSIHFPSSASQLVSAKEDHNTIRTGELENPIFKSGHTIPVRITYDASVQMLYVYLNNALTPILKTEMDNRKFSNKKFWVGFTASTSESFAQFTVHNWRFTTSTASTCAPGFEGAKCTVTNEQAAKECPRRESCGTCVEDVYNCVWCYSNKGGHCVVGSNHDTVECSTIALDPPTCSASVSKVGVYVLFVAMLIVIVFGVVVFKTLPVARSFRAITLIVALIGGSISGMIFSFMISASLVEITETKFFAICYGVFFLVQSIILCHHIYVNELPVRGFDLHTAILSIASVWIFATGIICFMVDHAFVHWLPETLKIFFYTVLGASLNFAIVFSALDIINEIIRRIQGRSWKRRTSIAYNEARVAILSVASVLSGLFFGFIFGELRVEEESMYRMAMALRQESLYTFPIGAIIGAVSSVLLVSIRLPEATDDEIDRLIREARDDL